MVRVVLAYIDPGSGALLWQAALSAFFGGLFLARRVVWRAVTGVKLALRGARDGPATKGEPPAEAPKTV